MNSKIATLFLIVLVAILACGGAATDDELRAEAVSALDGLAAELAAERPADAEGYAARLRTYLEEHPGFYGSAAALLDDEGNIVASPYVHRAYDGYVVLDLVAPSYDIAAQGWVTAPLDANAGVWTEPYFDAGGGEIWMITRAAPVRDDDGIFAIVTTDLPVDAP